MQAIIFPSGFERFQAKFGDGKTHRAKHRERREFDDHGNHSHQCFGHLFERENDGRLDSPRLDMAMPKSTEMNSTGRIRRVQTRRRSFRE